MFFTAFIIGIPLALFTALLAVLPAVSLPGAVDTAITGLFTLAQPFSAVVPLGSLFTILAIVLPIEAGLILWRIFNYIWRSIPVFGRH